MLIMLSSADFGDFATGGVGIRFIDIFTDLNLCTPARELDANSLIELIDSRSQNHT